MTIPNLDSNSNNAISDDVSDQSPAFLASVISSNTMNSAAVITTSCSVSVSESQSQSANDNEKVDLPAPIPNVAKRKLESLTSIMKIMAPGPRGGEIVSSPSSPRMRQQTYFNPSQYQKHELPSQLTEEQQRRGVSLASSSIPAAHSYSQSKTMATSLNSSPSPRSPTSNSLTQGASPLLLQQRISKEWKCKFEGCGAILKSKSSRFRHQRQHLNPESQYSCSFEGCQAKYLLKLDLVDHERKMHMDSSKYVVCGICERTFSSISNLNAHKEMHHKGSFDSSASLSANPTGNHLMMTFQSSVPDRGYTSYSSIKAAPAAPGSHTPSLSTTTMVSPALSIASYYIKSPYNHNSSPTHHPLDFPSAFIGGTQSRPHEYGHGLHGDKSPSMVVMQVCSICGGEYENGGKMTDHYRTHFNTTPPSSTIPSPSLAILTAGRDLECLYCEERVDCGTDKDSLERHVESRHMVGRRGECLVNGCGEVCWFVDEEDAGRSLDRSKIGEIRRRHVQMHHPGLMGLI